MRPIVSYTGMSLYEIAKCIANILKPSYANRKLNLMKLLVSFDVTSLYTIIPIDQELIIRDLLEHDEKLADRTLLLPR